jgi:polyhydroxybutyrate depolymerase
MPLVLVFHGGNGRGRSVQRNSGFNDLADQKGFFVAYPDGIDRHWNDGRLDTDNPDVDDVGFVAALIDHLVKTKKH